MAVTTINQTFEFNDKTLMVYGTVDEPLFKAKDVALMLEYDDTKTAIIDHVDKEDIQTWIKLKGGEMPPLLKMHPETKFINESGLYSLIMGSKKPEAKAFKRWVTKEVLPSIRKTGKYEMPKQPNDETTFKYLEMFERLADNRDKVIIRDYLRNKFSSVPLIKDKEEAEWSLSRRLSEKFNITQKKYHDGLTHVGKLMKIKYEEVRGKKPPTRTQYVHGTTRTVNQYVEKDFIDFGDKILKKYISSMD